MLNDLKLESFSPHLNTKFLIHSAPERTVEVELIEVLDLESTPRQEQFSIVFRGPRDQGLQQGIYRFEHEEIGAFEIFIVPFKRVEGSILYEAVFNRPL